MPYDGQNAQIQLATVKNTIVRTCQNWYRLCVH